MAYRYEEQVAIYEAPKMDETLTESSSEQSAYLSSIRTLGAQVRELALRSEFSAQSSYFMALKAANSVARAKLALCK